MALSRYPGVTIVGEVADVRAYLLRADVSVAPLRIARGVQNKVLEAMAMGVPVVATPSAIQGIDVSHGQELLVGDDAETFARQVCRLLADAELRRSVTKRALSKMKQAYDWNDVGAKLEQLLSNLAASRSGRKDGELGLSAGRC